MKLSKGFCQVDVQLGNISPDDVQVDLYSEEAIYKMDHWESQAGKHTYKIDLPADFSMTNFTPRILPKYGELLPLECPLILWQK